MCLKQHFLKYFSPNTSSVGCEQAYFKNRVIAPIPLETYNETGLNIQLNKVTTDSSELFKMLVAGKEQSVQDSTDLLTLGIFVDGYSGEQCSAETL